MARCTLLTAMAIGLLSIARFVFGQTGDPLTAHRDGHVDITIAERIQIPDTSASGHSTMAILPFYSPGIDYMSSETAELLLRQEVGKLTAMEIISEKVTAQSVTGGPCRDVACAVEIGEALGVDEVVLCSLTRLGEKIVVQYTLVDVGEKRALVMDNTTAEAVEDLEAVMKRVAASIVSRKSIEETAEVGAIMEREATPHLRRRAHSINGFSFGYLYPQNGYDGEGRSFTFDYRRGFEMPRLAVGAQLALRKNVAANIYTSYLLTRTDLCPYVGGAFGFHWVSHSDDDGNKHSDGFELTVNAGVRAFRTYNFQVLLNFDYAFTLNDYDDEALVVTIGLLH